MKLALALALGAQLVAADPPEVAGPAESQQLVAVEDFSVKEDAISGTLVNKSQTAIRNVQLLVQHRYRWPNEFKPGVTDPSRAERLTIDQEIPAGGRFAFTQPGQLPVAPGDGGRFDSTASVIAFEQIVPAPTASPPVSAPGGVAPGATETGDTVP